MGRNARKHGVRIIPLNLPTEQRELRKKHSLKLAGFKTGTLARDLSHIIQETKAKSIFIPRHPSTYRPMNYAYINFDLEQTAIEASKKYYELDGRKLYWGTQSMKTCHACGSPNYIIKECEIIKNQKPKRDPKLQKLYNKYKPAQHRQRPTSYADAAKRNTNSNKNTGGESSGSHDPKVQKELTEMRALLMDLSKQVQELVTEYKSNKNTSSHQTKTKPKEDTSNKSQSKNQPPAKKQKNAQDDLNNNGRRPWNKANITSNSSSSDNTEDPFMNKLDTVVSAIGKFQNRLSQLEDIQETYGTKGNQIDMEEDNNDDNIFA
jgi:hypothetical protein